MNGNMTSGKAAAATTVHDPAMQPGLEAPFAVGAVDVGMAKGSQGAYKRESRPVAAGSIPVQPALHGNFIHPIPPPKGDRW